jgi:hypothetical protein
MKETQRVQEMGYHLEQPTAEGMAVMMGLSMEDCLVAEKE